MLERLSVVTQASVSLQPEAEPPPALSLLSADILATIISHTTENDRLR